MQVIDIKDDSWSAIILNNSVCFDQTLGQNLTQIVGLDKILEETPSFLTGRHFELYKSLTGPNGNNY